MLLFGLGLGLAAASLLHAAAEAPITAVTVYSDRARVVRTATLNISGTQRVELPRLPELVDPDSIRVEAQGAQVSSVDVRPASAPPFPEQEARKLPRGRLAPPSASSPSRGAAWSPPARPRPCPRARRRRTWSSSCASGCSPALAGPLRPEAPRAVAARPASGRQSHSQPTQSEPYYPRQSQQSYNSRTGFVGARDSTLVGTIIDAQSRQPVQDVVITATTPSLEGEETMVSDAQGNYRIPRLPAGVYTLRFEKEQHRPYARSDIDLRARQTSRVNVELLPESLGEAVEITGAPPTIDVGSSATGVSVSLGGTPAPPRYSPPPEELMVDSYVGLSPPPGWRAPQLRADLPVSLAGGYDLAFTAPRLETARSGPSERTVPLLIESWPVQVERHVFPALATDAFLVAQLKGPSRGVLPGGEASLFVGADPAGSAHLKLVVPGEPFTLPLGVDPAVRTARNVRILQSQEGFISKDDLNTYEVTLEVPNPYPFAMQVRVVDQWPLNHDGKVEVKLERTEPSARQAEKTGELQWDLVVPPSSKKPVSFQYSLRRPRSWRLTQSP